MAWSNQQRKKTFQCWADMKQRCYNKNSKQFKNYGARGIVVCDKWKSSFDAFLNDMGDKPEGMSIERIDVNGNYDPGNCKWASRLEQAKNKRTTHQISFDGRCMTMREWANFLGRHEATLSYRKKQGCSIEQLLSPEILRQGSRPVLAAMGEKA